MQKTFQNYYKSVVSRSKNQQFKHHYDTCFECLDRNTSEYLPFGIHPWDLDLGNFYVFIQETKVLCVGSCFHYFCGILELDLVVVYTCIVEVVCGTMLGFGF
jgi:hypothetical protein